MFKEFVHKLEGTIFGITIAYAGLVTACMYVELKDKMKYKEEAEYLRSLIDKPEENYDHN